MKKVIITLSLASALLFIQCNQPSENKPESTQKDTLTAEQLHSPNYALSSLKIFDGLRAELMASEPLLKNPTNIDVDDRGRIWVTEAYNYRPEINNNPTNALGDRIMILEDLNQDGKIEQKP
jgi:hypothetical protein